jgi:PKD repeat protein
MFIVVAMSPGRVRALTPWPGFGFATNYATGAGTFAVASGEFNGDGVPDLAITNRMDNTLGVLFGNGDGTFGPMVAYPTGASPYSVAVGDFNGDGKADLAVANSSGSSVSILLGLGDGTFSAKADYAVGSGPSFVAVGDFDNDGQPDLVVTNSGNSTVSVLRGHPDGTFDPAVNFNSGNAPYAVAVGDLNNDGFLDLVVANLIGGDVSVLIGTGGGSFAPAVHYGSGSFPASVAIGDFNADGKLDFVAVNSGSGSNNVSVRLGNGDGTFQGATIYATGPIPDFVAIGDVNLDGVPDLAVASQTSNEVNIMIGAGDGSFAPPVSFGVGQIPQTLALADFDRNGSLDVAVANQGSSTVSVLLNIPGATACGSLMIEGGSDVTGIENQSVSIAASFSDAAGAPHTASVDWGDGAVSPAVVNESGTIVASHTYVHRGGYSAQVTIANTNDCGAGATIAVTIFDAPPVAGLPAATTAPVPVGTTVTAIGSFTDVSPNDSHTATWTWGDGASTSGSVDEGTGTVTGQHIYTAPGVYSVRFTVTDAEGLSADSSVQYVVVYDPSAGFVTGGGWIVSPAGAFVANPASTGRANFGFVSQYRKGAIVPDGNTLFQFQTANFDFRSTSYQWLVVSGARAQYRGYGTINGSGTFGFLLTATDGQLPGGGGADKFRIKVWATATGAVVYDNVAGAGDDPASASPQVIAGGSITIHN